MFEFIKAEWSFVYKFEKGEKICNAKVNNGLYLGVLVEGYTYT